MHPRYRLALPLLPFTTSAATFLASSLAAQCTQTTLVPSDVTVNEHAGAATAVSGFTAAVGNIADDCDANEFDDCGTVDIFRFERGQWVFDAALHSTPSSEAQWGQELGASVALWGQFCLAGAPWRAKLDNGEYWQTGAVVVFSRFNGLWSQQALLVPPGGAEAVFASRFGQSVAVDGEYAVVGAAGYPWNADSIPGRAFIYRRESPSNWVLEDDLPPNDLSGWYTTEFGEAVAIERGATNATTFAVVGVPHFDIAGSDNAGEVMVFTKPNSGTNWGNGWQVISNDLAAGDAFGCAVAVDELTMVVGAKGRDENGVSDVGAVYVFVRDTNGTDWNQVSKINCPDQATAAAFGTSVDIDGNTLVASSPALGRVYVYKKVGQFGIWVLDRTIVDPSATDANPDHMGASVSLSGSTILAGDPGNDLALFPEIGGAHLFSLDDAASNDNCGAGEVVVSGGSYTGCTIGATNDGSQSCVASSNATADVWYRFLATCDGTVVFDTLGSPLDTVLSVHSGCPGSFLNDIECNDDLGGFFTDSRITVAVTAGDWYRIRVAGKSGAVGAFNLNVSPCAPPCPFDLNGDQFVGGSDLAVVLGAWGAGANTPADLNHSGLVDAGDLAVLLGAWGPCN